MSITRHDEKHSAKYNHHPIATFVGASAAGAFETVLFYTPEAIARRLQVNKTRLYSPGIGAPTFLQNVKTAIFGNTGKMSFVQGMRDLYSGLGVGIVYKIAQRGYKIGGQKVVEHELNKHGGHIYNDWFGERNARLMLAGTSGMLVGIGEAPLLLPLDAIKVRYQTNKNSVAGKGFFTILLEQRTKLYQGLGWTMLRNAVGSCTLFMVNTAMKEYVCKPRHEKYREHYSLPEKIFASSVAALTSVLVSNPLDILKTRIQSGKEEGKSGLKIAGELLYKEGGFAFFKGVTTKALATAPKLTFALVVADSMAGWISKQIENSDLPRPTAPPTSPPADLVELICMENELFSVKPR